MRTSPYIFIVLLASAATAFAVKTERWQLDQPQDFMRGKLDRLTITGEGELHLGYGAAKLGDLAKEIWCSAVDRDGAIYFGTGSPADVYVIGKDRQPAKIAETDAIAVTALAVDSHGNIYAATLAEGKIYKISADKKQSTEFCRLRAPYIWSLVVDKDDHLFAGTGPDGKIYRISPDGKAEEWYVTEDSNILSLALDADGALLAGGSDRGLLYRITDKTKGVVLHQFAEDEVKSLVVSGQDLYVGVNKQKVKRPRAPGAARRPSAAEFEDLTQRLTQQFGARAAAEAAAQGGRETPPEARMGNLLAGALYLRNADGRVDQWASWDNESILDMAIDAEGGVLVAMANGGRVYRVPDSQHWELLFDLEEQQALTLAVRDGRLAFIGTGNVGSGYLVDAQKAGDGQYTSEVHDCKFLTTWGNLSWTGAGAITVATRTGNTALPDATWSDWSAPIDNPPAKVASPRARFIQVRIELSDKSGPRLQSLSLYYQMQNQKPDIDTVEVGEKPKPPPGNPKPEAGAEEKPDASAGDGGADGAAYQPQAADGQTEPFRPKPASPVKHIHWQASDKDGDTLVYRLYFQAQGDTVWVPVSLDKPLKKMEYSWNTESIPDGWYRIKVVASDEQSNPEGEALTDEKVSDPFKVNNTRPDVVALAYDSAGGVLTGTARDALSLIRFLEYSVDGGEWKYFAPKDGLFDAREKAFEIKLPALAGGEHYIAVRATDEEGNIGVGKLTIRTK
jgi:sugar lactone lactonase YvrE